MPARRHSGVPPFSAYAEELVLASILMDEGATVAGALSSILKPPDFYREQNAWVYEAALKAARRYRETTVPMVARWMMIDGTLDPAGAEPFLVVIVNRHLFDPLIGSVPAAVAHARLIRDYAEQRRAYGRAVGQLQEVATGKTRYNTVDVS